MALLFDPDAFEDVPSHEVERLTKKINWLWINRFIVKHYPLSGDMTGFFKQRVGKYRVIYTYDEASDDLIIHLVGHRDSIYKSHIPQ